MGFFGDVCWRGWFVDMVTKRDQVRNWAVPPEADHPGYKYKNDTWDACLTPCAALWIELTNMNFTTNWFPVHFIKKNPSKNDLVD